MNEIQKFIDYLKAKAWMSAALVLKEQMGYFGSWRSVEKYVTSMQEECPEEGYQFSAAFILVLAKLTFIDGRSTASWETAKKISDYILDRCDVSEGAITELSYNLSLENIHPTIRQQMSQVAFKFLDNPKLRDAYQLDTSWWRMPLI